MLEGMGRMYRRLVEKDACENRENRPEVGEAKGFSLPRDAESNNPHRPTPPLPARIGSEVGFFDDDKASFDGERPSKRGPMNRRK